MQDRLSWYGSSVSLPVWRRSLYSTQRLPVMGLAASARWISQGIRRGNMVESQTLRGRETVLVSQTERCDANDDNIEVGSWATQGWRAVCAERCKHGSGRGTRHALWANGPYSTVKVLVSRKIRA